MRNGYDREDKQSKVTKQQTLNQTKRKWKRAENDTKKLKETTQNQYNFRNEINVITIDVTSEGYNSSENHDIQTHVRRKREMELIFVFNSSIDSTESSSFFWCCYLVHFHFGISQPSLPFSIGSLSYNYCTICDRKNHLSCRIGMRKSMRLNQCLCIVSIRRIVIHRLQQR